MSLSLIVQLLFFYVELENSIELAPPVNTGDGDSENSSVYDVDVTLELKGMYHGHQP